MQQAAFSPQLWAEAEASEKRLCTSSDLHTVFLTSVHWHVQRHHTCSTMQGGTLPAWLYCCSSNMRMTDAASAATPSWVVTLPPLQCKQKVSGALSAGVLCQETVARAQMGECSRSRRRLPFVRQRKLHCLPATPLETLQHRHSSIPAQHTSFRAAVLTDCRLMLPEHNYPAKDDLAQSCTFNVALTASAH